MFAALPALKKIFVLSILLAKVLDEGQSLENMLNLLQSLLYEKSDLHLWISYFQAVAKTLKEDPETCLRS
jgi:hypothetical protein